MVVIIYLFNPGTCNRSWKTVSALPKDMSRKRQSLEFKSKLQARWAVLCAVPREPELRKEASSPFSSVQFSSVAQSCPTLCNPMNRSTPGLPVRHQLPEFTQTHVYRVSDAIQPSHPLSSPSPPAPNPSYRRLIQVSLQWRRNKLHLNL